MRQLVSAVTHALDQKNFEAALFVALTLPDVCAATESADGRTSAEKYKAWFDRFMAPRYIMTIAGGQTHVFLSAGDCYALRCAMLHQAIPDITGHAARQTLERFEFTVLDPRRGSIHLNQAEATLQLDVARFCQDICEGVEAWLNVFQEEHKDLVGRLADQVQIRVIA